MMEITETTKTQQEDGTWKVWFKAEYERLVYTDTLYYGFLPEQIIIDNEMQTRADNWYNVLINTVPVDHPDIDETVD